MKTLLSFYFTCSLVLLSFAQCPTCGNGAIDAGETELNCPTDIAHTATCTSPCGQPTSFESTVGIRTAYDFVGTTTYSTTGLPAGWSFAGAPSATSSGTLPTADIFGAKAGLVQPNCSGSCTSTNFFCIGNLANSVTVGSGGSGGKLGANFDGRTNVNQNSSYAILRGTSNPTLVSETFNMSSVQGFKIQFWLIPSETSCGQSNSWGSCVGNAAYLDFSSDGGATWSQVLTMNLSSSNSDMCLNNTSNTLWLNESSWSRVCLTVFKSTSAPGNFYTAASSATAASGIMVNNAYFTATFKFRIRYVQSASCTNATATNPGRYLAIDFPVITSGNQMIPCGISFANMCGYGQDDNDDGVGSTATSTTTVFGTVRRSVNQAERGVEIFNSQNSVFASQNLSGSTFTSNFDLCNAEGGDRQCIDWQSNNNSQMVVYECITDWEAPTGNINLNYYKGTSPQSFGLSKVTASGKTALIGWRYSGMRFVTCGSSSDLNPGCNGYSFQSSLLPSQFSRGFYALAVNSTGQSWSYYGASSCSNYFGAPFIAPIASPEIVGSATNYVVCNGPDLVFTGDVSYCSSSIFTGSQTLDVTGPSGFSESFDGGSTGVVPITTPGDYTVLANTPTSPPQCFDCSKSVCITVTQAEIDACITALPVGILEFNGLSRLSSNELFWKTSNENNYNTYRVERSLNGLQYIEIGQISAKESHATPVLYSFVDSDLTANNYYYRLKLIDQNGTLTYSSPIHISSSIASIVITPNPSKGEFTISGLSKENELLVYDSQGKTILKKNSSNAVESVVIPSVPGVYILQIRNEQEQSTYRLVIQ